MSFNFLNKDPKYAKYKIGKHSYGNPKIEDWNQPNITLEIGNFCSIARDVTIYLGGNHHSEWVSTFPLNHILNYDTNKHTKHKYDQIGSKGSVIIGNDVWIGTEAVILSGLNIGDGAIIGANSIISKNVEPYSVWVGNPAKFIKKRFSDNIIAKLLEIKWWNWDDEKIKEATPLLLNSDISKFIEKYK
jgi:acetyltransferase-like isoleucine patch superfamily enzyme